MKKYLIAAALAAVSFITPASATVLGKVGNWTIEDDGTGCMMWSAYEQGFTLSVIGDKDESLLFVVQNRNWSSIQDDAIYKLQIEFDNLGQWRNINAIADKDFDRDGPALAWVASPMGNKDGDNFVAEFAYAQNMVIRKDGRQLAKLDLTDTYKAIITVARCTDKYRNPRDPFRNIQPDEVAPKETSSRGPTA